ncbi:unnamed protein product [Dibothriocephalus latus]|uniref:Uncharacterized protein n=1 Tax=Dibothriocephalus latus TaxID=60516 RepID=A0A3P7LQ46_DIBLA|nr:unnamed protein product [Dibothriocephalus latus]
MPGQRATLSTTAPIGRAKTFLMPFFNPLTYPVNLRVLLKPLEIAPSATLDENTDADTSQDHPKQDGRPRFEAFRLLMNQARYVLTRV